MTRNEWNRCVGAVIAIWPESQWPASTAAAGWSLCRDLAEGSVREAIATVAREGRAFAPTVSEVYAQAAVIAKNAVPALPVPEPSDEELARGARTLHAIARSDSRVIETYHEFHVHAADCETCGKARLGAVRLEPFDAIWSKACVAGRELLEPWLAARHELVAEITAKRSHRVTA